MGAHGTMSVDFQKLFKAVKNEDDSMGDDEEYQPIDYKQKITKIKKKKPKRNKRDYNTNERPSKRQKRSENAESSKEIIKNMKEKKDYNERSSTKVIASNA